MNIQFKKKLPLIQTELNELLMQIQCIFKHVLQNIQK